jgi:hypothetical protein
MNTESSIEDFVNEIDEIIKLIHVDFDSQMIREMMLDS